MRIIVFLIVITIFCQCTRENSIISKNEIDEEIIDFNKLEQHEYHGLLPDELVENREFILLENNTSDSQLGRIDKLMLRNKRIYAMDWIYRNLLIFDMKGNLIHKFNRRGDGPGHYRQISDFDIDAQGNLYILDAGGKQILVYDKDLNHFFSRRLTVDAERIIFMDQDKFLLGLSPWNSLEWSGYRFAVADKEFNVSTVWDKYDDNVDQNFVFSFNFVKSENQISFNRPIENKVYLFSNEGEPLEIYNFDFGSQNVPDEVRKNLDIHLTNLWQYRFLSNFVVVHRNFIVGTIGDGLARYRNFLLDKSKNIVYIEKPTVPISTTDMTIRQDLLFTLSDIDGDKLVSFLHPDSYERAQEYGLPQEVISHLMNEGYVICLEELK
ncbi:6-bladed beta-propeller [Fulvivirgaceae bacterium LMO-SS25]